MSTILQKNIISDILLLLFIQIESILMKIISPFKDYYDGVAVSDYSSELTFIRYSQFMKASDISALKDFIGPIYAIRHIHPILIFVNDKVFLAIHKNGEFHFDKDKIKLLYKEDKWVSEKAIDKLFSLVPKTSTVLQKEGISFAVITDTSLFGSDTFKEVDQYFQDQWQLYVSANKNIWGTITLIINPKFAMVNLQKILPAYQLNQEVEQVIANQVNPEHKLIQISNKDRIVQHGFDLKQSFRHRKQKGG